jgi:hypothetical protein
MQVGPCIHVGAQLQKGWGWPNFWADMASFSLANLIEKIDLSLAGSMEAV